jgi:hypothetical protein
MAARSDVLQDAAGHLFPSPQDRLNWKMDYLRRRLQPFVPPGIDFEKVLREAVLI